MAACNSILKHIKTGDPDRSNGLQYINELVLADASFSHFSRVRTLDMIFTLAATRPAQTQLPNAPPSHSHTVKTGPVQE